MSGMQLKHAARELHTWSKCQHPNILALLGLADYRGRLGIISPWMPHGSVRQYLEAYPDADRCDVCRGICDGLAYLHKSNVVHGDLKGANVLFCDRGTPKLSDFGNSILNESSMQYTNSQSETGISPRWTAPEIFNGEKQSYAGDVFALGMTLLETITGSVPFHELQDLAVIMAIGTLKKVPKRPETHIPSGGEHGDALWAMLVRCWSHEPKDRPTVGKVQEEMKTITRRGLSS